MSHNLANFKLYSNESALAVTLVSQEGGCQLNQNIIKILITTYSNYTVIPIILKSIPRIIHTTRLLKFPSINYHSTPVQVNIHLGSSLPNGTGIHILFVCIVATSGTNLCNGRQQNTSLALSLLLVLYTYHANNQHQYCHN